MVSPDQFRLLLCAAIFGIDCLAPANLHVALLYTLIPFLGGSPTQRGIWVTASVSVVLTFAGIVVGAPATPGTNLSILWLNRLLVSCCIGAVAYVHQGLIRAERQRDESENELRKAVQARETFLAILAHELRNPLAPLRSGLAILQHSKGGDQSRLLAIMERQVNQLVRLVDDLLDISRIRGGKIKLRREVVDIVNIIRNAAEACKPVSDKARQRVTFDIPSNTPLISADPARIVQAVTNLLDNSSKFSPEGGEIVLSVEIQNDSVVISVKDNGRGIAPEAIPKVFDLFMREANSDETRGLGIGLALVKEVAELHGGGSVEVRSEGLEEAQSSC